MFALTQRFRPHPEVVDTELDEAEVALLHLDSKIYYSLNRTGARIWDGVKRGLSLNEISQRLQDEFDVDAERAERSVLTLIEDLSRQHLIEVVE